MQAYLSVNTFVDEDQTMYGGVPCDDAVCEETHDVAVA